MPTQTAGLNKLGTTPEQQQHRRAFESGEEKTQTHKQTTKQNNFIFIKLFYLYLIFIPFQWWKVLENHNKTKIKLLIIFDSHISFMKNSYQKSLGEYCTFPGDLLVPTFTWQLSHPCCVVIIIIITTCWTQWNCWEKGNFFLNNKPDMNAFLCLQKMHL